MVGSDSAERRAREHLVAAAEWLERSSAAGRHETLLARVLAESATLLEHADVTGRAQAVLRRAPDSAFLAGAITNIAGAGAGPGAVERLRATRSVDEIARDHVTVTVTELKARLRRWAETEPHVAMCLSGRQRDAVATADSSRMVAEIAATLAVLGDIDAARALLRHPALDASHREGLLVVLMIESARRGRTDGVGGNESSADLGELGAWSRVHLALGLAGRDPWAGYPFPDW